jgi:hypothetical protein
VARAACFAGAWCDGPDRVAGRIALSYDPSMPAARLFRLLTIGLSALGVAAIGLGVSLLLDPPGAHTAAGRIALGVVGGLGLVVGLAVPLRVGFSGRKLPAEIKAAMRINGLCIAAGGLALVSGALLGGGRGLGVAFAASGGCLLVAAWAGFFRLGLRLPPRFTVRELGRVARSAGLLARGEESAVGQAFGRWTDGGSAGVPVGAPAPDGPARTLAGDETTLHQIMAASGADTVVLNLGSYSCPHHRRRMDELNALVARWSPRGVAFVTVYINEAHPEDGWRLERQYEEDPEYQGRPEDFCFLYARSIDDRLAMARRLVDAKGLRMTVVADTMADTLMRAYNAWPIRLYVLHRGQVAFAGEQGPFGYLPAAVDEALGRLAIG